ncbi:hypothetical protein FE249_06955 [Acidiphilium multivorum]|uniref:PD-(D/E)XK nuclease family protein n=1 Tax=Acidiphilium multivorum TaxID=62140 RepID=UPI001F4C1BC3|nr:PD-(D/E)XK nuclease family protein [Acidiphilium multivorum]UNC13973.1 hypothetical protein FE249_06955 [Acidiphilium multivorum]
MNAYEDEIQELLINLVGQLPELDAQTQGIQMFDAPRLNAFSMLAPDERRISRFLAALLNPKEQHGQGTLFLNAFLTSVWLPPVKRQTQVSIVNEHATFWGRRVDITIRTPEAFLGIEVKLRAKQQANQLKDYVDDLKSNAQKQRTALVFLADQKPESAAGEVIRMPWVKVIEDTINQKQTYPLASILQHTLPQVRAARMRAILEDFLAWITEHFGDAAMGSYEHDIYIDAVCNELTDPKRRRALGAILTAERSIHRKVLDLIGEAILASLHALAPTFYVDGANTLATGIAQKYGSWIIRQPHWPENLHVGITAEGSNFSEIGFGVSAPDGTHEAVLAEGEMAAPCPASKQLADEFRSRKLTAPASTPHWPWFDQRNPKDWGIEFAARILLESPDGDIAKHPNIQLVTKEITFLANIIDEVFDNPDRNRKEVRVQ